MKAIHAFPRAARILRSVMIAGAGTAVWMALSASAASADSGNSNNQSLLGGITSPVSSTTGVKDVPAKLHKTLDATVEAAKDTKASVANVVAPKPSAPAVTIPVPDVPLPAAVKPLVPGPAVTVTVPSVTPVVEQVAESTDSIVGTLPFVSEVVPEETVGGVVDTAVTPVSGAVEDTVAAVVPPVNDALKPIGQGPVTDATKPVLEPIVGVVDAVLPPRGGVIPPLTGPDGILPVLPVVDTSVLPTKPGSSATPPAAVVVVPLAPAAETSLIQPPTEVAAGGVAEAEPGVLTPSHEWPRTFAAAQAVTAVGTATTADDEAPGDLPFGPDGAPPVGTGVGSGGSQNGPPSPAAAYLDGALIIPADLISGLASAGNEQHPEPVSFDPGSSPD